MKRNVLLVIAVCCLAFSSRAQVGYGTNNPDPRAVVDLNSNDKALYLPRLTTAEITAQNDWKAGMVVYNTDSNCVVYFRGATDWDCSSRIDTLNLQGDTLLKLSLRGDSLAKTLDLRPLVKEPWFGTDDSLAATTNTEDMFVMSSKVGIGTSVPRTQLDVEGNFRVGNLPQMTEEVFPDNNDLHSSNFNDYSLEHDYWGGAGSGDGTITQNLPDAFGGTTAVRYATTTTNGARVLKVVLPNQLDGPYVISFWVKKVAGTVNNVDVRASIDPSLRWELDIPITTSWSRVSVVRSDPTHAIGGSAIPFGVGTSNDGASLTIDVCGFQIDQGVSVLTPFTQEPSLPASQLTIASDSSTFYTGKILSVDTASGIVGSVLLADVIGEINVDNLSIYGDYNKGKRSVISVYDSLENITVSQEVLLGNIESYNSSSFSYINSVLQNDINSYGTPDVLFDGNYGVTGDYTFGAVHSGNPGAFGFGYSFAVRRALSKIRVQGSPRCEGGLGFFELYDNGVLVHTTSTLPVIPGGNWYEVTISPVIATDEVRYLLSPSLGNSICLTELEYIIDDTVFTYSREDVFFIKDGLVGIGTAAPAHNLSVDGTAGKTNGGSWTVFSDSRIKKDIRPYKGGLNELVQVKPVIFKYNERSGYDDTVSDYVGIIAQEIEKVFPNTISQIDDSEGPSGLYDKRDFNESELLWTTINAIKELYAENEVLRKELDVIKKRLDELKKE